MGGTLTNNKIFELMELWSPRSLAYEWDNVGLQIGSYSEPVKKIMVTLDVLESVVDEAINKNVNLIIAHHPLFFKSFKQIDIESNQGRMIKKLIEHRITVYAAHTNLDLAEGGVNDMLCDKLALKKCEPLMEIKHEKLYKIAVFVPTSHSVKVGDALSEHGAGHIGNYSHCTFQSEGHGTFKPLAGTNPFIGSQEQLEKVAEVKIETIVQENKLANVIRAMIEAHPYEEVAYDIYPLENRGKTYGLGRIGMVTEELTLAEFCETVKNAFNVPKLRVVGDLTKKINRVAILGGSGEKYIDAAKEKNADVYITGDMSFHVAQDAWQMGLSVVDPGHHVEKVMIAGVKNFLEEKLADQSIDIIMSESNTEPFIFV